MSQNTSDSDRAQPPEVLFRGSGGRCLLFHFRNGEGLPPHTHAGQGVVVAALAGRVRFEIDGQSLELAAGECRAVSGNTFSSQAQEDGTRLLVSLISE